MCRLDGDVYCKARGVHCKISCEGVDDKGEQCSDVNYEGETSRSTGERFAEHMHLLYSKKEQVRQKSILYDHVWQCHNREVPHLKFEKYITNSNHTWNSNDVEKYVTNSNHTWNSTDVEK